MASFARTVVRYAYVPFMLLGLNCAALWIVTGGHSYPWLFPLLLVGFATAFLAERILPVYNEWNAPHGDEKATLFHVLVYESGNVFGLLLIPLVAWLLNLKPGGLIGVWPREWPILAQLLLAITLADFVFTVIHFLSHRWTTLWRLHAVHHGVGRLYGFNGVVRHPLHQLLDMGIGTAPLAFAGMPVGVATLLAFAISIQLIVQHSNVDYALGPFRNHLSLGRLHHLHHVNWGKEGDCNFGLFLTLWDRLLGTFNPEPSRAIAASDMGIDEIPAFPKQYRDQLLFPFRYKPGSGLAQTPAGEARAVHEAQIAGHSEPA